MFVARQPIVDSNEKLFGYELLFRDGLRNLFPNVNPEVASVNVLDDSLLVGLDVLCAGRYAFVNTPHDLLVSGCLQVLPAPITIVEVLESINPDSDVLNACLKLKEAGFRIALDDYVLNDRREPLVPVCDIIKVDIQAVPPDHQDQLVRRLATPARQMVAERVETRDEFVRARARGFSYFQGFFFRKPEIISTPNIGNDEAYQLQLLEAGSRQPLDFREIEDLLKHEASLCYRLLRFLNSAMFGLTVEVRSIRQALTILGEQHIRRWLWLVAAANLGRSRAGDLLSWCLTRARFCELLAPQISHENYDLFLFGLLSAMEPILGRPMAQVLDRLPLDKEFRDALVGKPSRLLPIAQLMVAQESGDWGSCTGLANELGLTEVFVASCHAKAMQWADEVSCRALESGEKN